MAILASIAQSTPHFGAFTLDSALVELKNPNDIFHFVGSPKPFDFLGEFIHPNYMMFYDSLTQTIFRDYKSYLDFSFAKSKRTVKLSRSYYNLLKKKVGHQLTSTNSAIESPVNSSSVETKKKSARISAWQSTIQIDD